MRRNKKLAKRIGCGLLAGTLALSGVMPFSSTDSITIKAADTSDTYTATTSKGARGVGLTADHLYEWCSAAKNAGYRNAEQIKDLKVNYDFDVDDETLMGGIKTITDKSGNKWSGNLVSVTIDQYYGPGHKNWQVYVFQDIKCVDSNGNDIGTLPATIDVKINNVATTVPCISIASNALTAAKNIKKLNIPYTYSIIEAGAFYNASKLEEVTFYNEDGTTTNKGENLAYIGDSAFAECTNLKNAILPSQLFEGEMDNDNNFKYVLNDTKYRSTYYYPGSEKKLGTEIYKDCKSLKEVEISGENVAIPRQMFLGCDNIESININAKKALFQHGAFSGAGRNTLTNLEFNCDVLCGSYAFADNPKLQSVVFNKGFKTMEMTVSGGNIYNTSEGIFNKCFQNAAPDGKENYVKFKGIKNTSNQIECIIPPYCFQETGYLDAIYFADDVQKVEVTGYAFKDTGISKLNIKGNGITDVNFRENSLKGLTNTNSLNVESQNKIDIWNGAFDMEGTTSVKNITLNAPTVYLTQINGSSLTLGDKVTTLDTTLPTHTSYRRSFGNISNIYITSPNTDITSYSDFPDEAYMLYGYNDTLYSKRFTERNFTKAKFSNYIKELDISAAQVTEGKITLTNTEFNPNQIKVVAKYSDDTEEILSYSQDGSTGYSLKQKTLEDFETYKNSSELAEITLGVSYYGAEGSEKVILKPKEVTDFTISVKENTTFVEGTNLDKSMFTVSNITYNDGNVENAASNPEDITVKLKSGSDKVTRNINNKDTVIVTYKGKSKEFDIDVATKSITKLTAKLKDPNKVYCAGSQFTSDEFTVTAEYSNGDKNENFKDYTISTNIIPNTVSAGIPYVVKISAGNITTEIALNISIPKIKDLIVSYTGAGVLEGDSIDKNNVKVTALYDNLTTAELKPNEYMLVYEPIVADMKNQVKVVYLSDTSITGTFEVTGLKRTEFDPTAGPIATPTLLPTTAPTTAPTTVPTATQTVAPTAEPTVAPVVSITPAPTVDVPVPATQTPIVTAQPTMAPTATEQPIQTVSPDVVPNTGVTKLKATKYTLGLKEKVTISLTGGQATSFVSSNSKVATVTSKGVVKATKVGTTTVYVVDEFGKTKSVKITVKKAPKTVKASVNKKILKVGKKFTIKAKFTKGYYSNKITFTSSNKKVATVNKNGVILAKKKGKTTITLKTYNGKKVKVTVTVK